MTIMRPIERDHSGRSDNVNDITTKEIRRPRDILRFVFLRFSAPLVSCPSRAARAARAGRSDFAPDCCNVNTVYGVLLLHLLHGTSVPCVF